MYINKEQRQKVNESAYAITTISDLAYEITVFMLSMWNQHPNNETIEKITKELVVDQKNSRLVQNLRSTLADRFTVAEVYTACRLAYDEFYQRVIRLHRALECRDNGDIEGYMEAIPPLLTKLGQEIKKETASQLIIPGNK